MYRCYKLNTMSFVNYTYKAGGNVQVLLRFNRFGIGMLDVLQRVGESCRIKIQMLRTPIAPDLPVLTLTKNVQRNSSGLETGDVCCGPALTLN